MNKEGPKVVIEPGPMTSEYDSIPFVVYMTISDQEASLQLQSTTRNEWCNAVICLFTDDAALLSAIRDNTHNPVDMVIFGDQVEVFN